MTSYRVYDHARQLACATSMADLEEARRQANEMMDPRTVLLLTLIIEARKSKTLKP